MWKPLELGGKRALWCAYKLSVHRRNKGNKKMDRSWKIDQLEIDELSPAWTSKWIENFSESLQIYFPPPAILSHLQSEANESWKLTTSHTDTVAKPLRKMRLLSAEVKSQLRVWRVFHLITQLVLLFPAGSWFESPRGLFFVEFACSSLVSGGSRQVLPPTIQQHPFDFSWLVTDLEST